jgi:hypothetical protein
VIAALPSNSSREEVGRLGKVSLLRVLGLERAAVEEEEVVMAAPSVGVGGGGSSSTSRRRLEMVAA